MLTEPNCLVVLYMIFFLHTKISHTFFLFLHHGLLLEEGL